MYPKNVPKMYLFLVWVGSDVMELGLLSLHLYRATFRVAAIHVYKIGLPFKLGLA